MPETAFTVKDFFPLINVMGGVIIGGAISYFNTSRLETRKQEGESRRLALAFQGEIRALIGIIDRQKYLDSLQWLIDEMERTDKKHKFHHQIRRNYFLVFQSNVGNIGLLPCPLPALIAQFYVQASSVLEDVENHREGAFDGVNLQDYIFSIKNLHSLLQDTVQLGADIIKETNILYPTQTR